MGASRASSHPSIAPSIAPFGSTAPAARSQQNSDNNPPTMLQKGRKTSFVLVVLGGFLILALAQIHFLGAQLTTVNTSAETILKQLEDEKFSMARIQHDLIAGMTELSTVNSKLTARVNAVKKQATALTHAAKRNYRLTKSLESQIENAGQLAEANNN